MALFSSPMYSNMMHHSQNGESSIALPLAHATPSAQSCTISELIAFPSSLAALKHGVKWNASCWVANQRLNEFEQEQIALHAFQGQQRMPHIEWCHFATSIDDTVSLLIVFPQLAKSFRSLEIMERWTDSVVLPAFRATGISDGTLTSNFNIIRMTAEAEREQTLNTFAPDTTLSELLSKTGGLSSQDVHTLWTTIMENANRTVFFDGFKHLFLVAIHRRPMIAPRELPLIEAWREATRAWDNAIDMAFVPIESVRADASVSIMVQAVARSSTSLSNHTESLPARKMTADSIWESSRKRRLDEEGDNDKRKKLENNVSSSIADMMDI